MDPLVFVAVSCWPSMPSLTHMYGNSLKKLVKVHKMEKKS